MATQTYSSTNGAANGAANGAKHSNDPLPKELVDEMQALFGKHPGFRTSMYITIFD
jgi:catalase